MMNLKRIQSVLALLLVGSASLWADGDDPFPAVDTYKYQGNMTLTAKAMLNGVALTSDDIVAVYYGDEIRGKVRPNAKSILYLTITGDSKTVDMYFKVYTGGRIIEVDQGFQYSWYATVGTPDDPYIITVPTPVVTTPSSEGWATTCLPFNAEVPAGVSVWNATGIANGELVMEKCEGSILPKDTPVLLQSNGLASYEWLSRVADGDVTITSSIFSGTTAPTAVAANSVLTLGHNDVTGEIGFWSFTGTTVPANRAYIADVPSGARGARIRMEDDTAIECQEIEYGRPTDGLVYDLQGRRIESSKSVNRQLNKGVYIIGNKKVIIR